MPKKKKTKEVFPDTTRVVEGFRDTGYTFSASVADIIDNSIGAGEADTIAVVVGLDPLGVLVVSVADDGCGMSLDDLEEAMRYGAPRQANPNSLSKFGLGMKTASTQFCKRLVVVSQTPEMAQAGAAAWDLDVIEEQNKWILEHDTADEEQQQEIDSALAGLAQWSQSSSGSGTLVKWEKVDRLLRTKAGKDAKNQTLALTKATEALKERLSIIFQRFLDPLDDRERNVKILVNDELVEVWDPFAENKGGELVFSTPFVFTAADGAEHSALMRAFILPRKEECADEEAFRAMRVSLERQGIYLYRENRMIDGPDWLKTGSRETHCNNLRVELSFEAQLDDVFGVGLKKSGVEMDPELVVLLQDAIRPVRNEANNRSRKGKAKSAAGAGNGGQRPTDRTISRAKGRLHVPEVKQGADGSVVLVNKTGDVAVVSGGQPTGIVNVSFDEEFADMNVVRRESLKDGVLWQGSLSTHNVLQVELNAGHDWYQKAYLPIAEDLSLVQAIEFFFYALAQAELNATDSERRAMFEDLRVDVSRNLRQLVADLPATTDE